MTRSGVMGAEFGRRLKLIRARVGLTQEGLARAADVSLSTVAKLERGEVDPSWNSVQRLAKALGVKTEGLLPVQYGRAW